MKKYFYFIGFLLVATLAASLSACQKPAMREADNTEHAPLNRRIGQIDSLGGIKTTSQGTHLLKLDDGSAILLKSLNINLDDPKYRLKILEVRGLLTYTKDKKQIMNVENIDVLEEAVTQQQVIARWKDYINPVLGFSARYRDDFQIQETSKRVDFVRQVKITLPPLQTTQAETEQKETSSMQNVNAHIFSVEIAPHASEKTLLQFLGLENDNINSLYAAGFTKSKIGTNGLDAYRKSDAQGKDIRFYLDHSNTFYEIRFSGTDNSQILEDQNVFYDFINSFKFI